MRGIKVRLEEPSDRAASVEVEALAFGDPAEAGIVEAIRDEGGSFALVATDGDVVVGHAQLSRAWIGEEPVVALGPIGVLPDRQREGVGSALVMAALEEARRRRLPAVILLGDPAFYGRFGFRPAARWGLRNPFAGVQGDGFVIAQDDFMLVPLADERSFSGDVRWHVAFGQVG